MKTIETTRLAPTEAVVRAFVRDRSDGCETRFQLLEAVAARLGGFDLEGFQSRFQIEPVERPSRLLDHATRVVESLDDTGIHPALCLSALARERLELSSRRARGAYHTDFRLARYLAGAMEGKLSPASNRTSGIALDKINR